MNGWRVRVHGGTGERAFQTWTGVYVYAAAAVPAVFGLDLPVDFEIWSDTLAIADKRFHFRVRENEFGGVVVEQLVRVQNVPRALEKTA